MSLRIVVPPKHDFETLEELQFHDETVRRTQQKPLPQATKPTTYVQPRICQPRSNQTMLIFAKLVRVKIFSVIVNILKLLILLSICHVFDNNCSFQVQYGWGWNDLIALKRTRIWYITLLCRQREHVASDLRGSDWLFSRHALVVYQ